MHYFHRDRRLGRQMPYHGLHYSGGVAMTADWARRAI